MNEYEQAFEKAKFYRNEYPAGTRIELIQMGSDPRPVPSGTKGTVVAVDDMCQIHMRWDNGRTLALIPGEDSFKIIPPEEKITLRPWKGNEKLYFYRQSQQLSGQTGQIGFLRADMDVGGGFFSTWNGIKDHLKTQEFKDEFDNVINYFRFKSPDTPLGNRKILANYLAGHPEAALPGDGNHCGFRADTENYSYFFRLTPEQETP